LWNTADPYLYIRLTKDDRVIVGGRDEEFFNPQRRDKLLNRKSNLLSKDFNKMFNTKFHKAEFSWCGTFGVTKDSLPYIGTLKNKNNYFALGFGGNGITFSVIAAQMITKSISGRKNPDMKLFSFDR
jgi:glycine/D-amino acid oxidase-like deaminating enzyme